MNHLRGSSASLVVLGLGQLILWVHQREKGRLGKGSHGSAGVSIAARPDLQGQHPL